MSSNLISLYDFTNNFTTYIRDINTTPHVEGGSNIPFAVGFNVICRPNNRVMYFEAHMNSNNLLPTTSNPSAPTDAELVDSAWSNLIPDVKTWATGAFTACNLIGSQFHPVHGFTTTSNFDLFTYNSNFTTRVARFEVYPATQPSSWCIGFNVIKTASPSETFYIDTNVVLETFAVTLAEEELLTMGWSNTKEAIGNWAESKNTLSVLLNTQYNTSNW